MIIIISQCKVQEITQNMEILQVKIKDYIQERKKEMFYLTTHSTHFIYGYMAQTYGLGPF